MFKQTCAMIGMVLLTGCQAPGVPAVPAGPTAPTAQAATMAPPTRVDAAVVRRLMDAEGPSPARMWGFRLRSDVPKMETTVTYVKRIRCGNDKYCFDDGYDAYYSRAQIGWQADFDYAGDGEVEHLGKGRFLYRVPAGRVLVLNAADFAGSIKLNGFPLGLKGDASRVGPPAATAVDFLFGPGESVLIEMTPTSGSYEWLVDCPALKGFTADPALLGGRLAAELGVGGAAK